jgi:photosystem II stability/assembly factor-like uncharacterized protein
MLLRTTSGGIQWTDVTPVDSSGHKIDGPYFHAFNSRIAWVEKVSLAAITEIFRTIDGGRTWKSAAVPAPSVTSISFINPREGWLIAFLVAALGANESADIYRSTDGGATWMKVAWSPGLPYGVKRSISFLNSATGWITVLDPRGNRPYLYVTHDGGRTWRSQDMPLPRELTPRWEARPEPPKFFSSRNGSISVHYDILNDSGERTRSVIVLYATHDGGTTWTYTASLQVNASEAVYQAVADMNHAWVLNGGVLHTTSDGGQRWVAILANPLLAVDAKQLDFISPQTGWAIRRTFPFLLKTLDGGRTWAPVAYAVLSQ